METNDQANAAIAGLNGTVPQDASKPIQVKLAQFPISGNNKKKQAMYQQSMMRMSDPRMFDYSQRSGHRPHASPYGGLPMAHHAGAGMGGLPPTVAAMNFMGVHSNVNPMSHHAHSVYSGGAVPSGNQSTVSSMGYPMSPLPYATQPPQQPPQQPYGMGQPQHHHPSMPMSPGPHGHMSPYGAAASAAGGHLGHPHPPSQGIHPMHGMPQLRVS
jgi:hypothetical protein